MTRNLLLKVESLVFLVAGQEKADVLEKILNDPGSTVAGQAVRGISQTELWYSHERPDAGADRHQFDVRQSKGDAPARSGH